MPSIRILMALALIGASAAHADTSYHALSSGSFVQNWSNTSQISVDDNWSGVPSLEGYRGDNLTSAQGVDPRTILAFGASPIDVNANRTDPSSFSTGGLTEVEGGSEIGGNPVVGFQGSNTADAPFLLLRLNTNGCGTINVSYLLRDIDTADNAVDGQPVVLQARIGESGDFSNVAGTFIQTANNNATSSFNVPLDSAFQNQPQVQLRWLTTNAAAASDALIGIDDINVSCGGGADLPPAVSSTQPANAASNVARDANIVVQFNEAVTTNAGWFTLNCAQSGNVAYTTAGAGSSRTVDPTPLLAFGESCTATVVAANVIDLDGTPDPMASNVQFVFTVVPDLVPSVASTVPGDNAANVPVGTNVDINFSEPVTTSGSWYQIQCSVSGARTAVASGGPVNYSLDIAGTLEFLENCVVTLNGALIVDQDGTPDPMSSNFVFDFTTAASASNYYSSVNASNASTLRSTLHALIDDHIAYRYSIGTNTCNVAAPSVALCDVWDILEAADQDPANPNRVLDVYRNRSYQKITDRSGATGPTTYNREHTWPNSLGFNDLSGVDANNNPYSPYVDAHMLYASASDYNANRGNKPFDNCGAGTCAGTENPTDVNNGAGGGTGTYPGESNWQLGSDGNTGTYEVWRKRKGDMARAILYMDIRYEGGTHANGQAEPNLIVTNDRNQIVVTPSNQVPNEGYMGVLSTLIAWHLADPPDAQEQLRNEVVFLFQGNRNPFIDHPEWVACLWQNACGAPGDDVFRNGFE